LKEGRVSIEKILEIEEQKFIKSSSPIEKLSSINLIIQLKYKIYGESCLDQLYRDVKIFIEYIVLSVKERIYGYDYIDTNKLKNMFLYFDPERRYYLYLFLERILKSNGFEEDLMWAKTELKKTEIEYLCKRGWKKNGIFKNIFRLIFTLSSLNICSMLMSLLVIVAVTCVILLPAPFQKMEIFNIKYHSYSNNFILNHILNVISGFIGLLCIFRATLLPTLNTPGFLYRIPN
jgi:hypothetical protein